MKSRLPNNLFTLSLLVSIGSVSMAPVALAQTFPSNANPGVLVNPTIQEQQQSAPSSKSPLPNNIDPASTVEGGEAQPNVPVATESTTFRADKIEVQGNTILKQDEVRKIVAPYEGRDLNPEELSALIGKLNDAYRLRGFLTSLAFIPPQDLERGTITVKVLEGQIGDMEVTGNKYLRSRVVANRIQEKPGDKLNLPKLEKELLQINRSEPYRLKAILSPGANTGETRVRLEVQEQQPFQIAATFDNAGRPYIGTYRAGIELMDRNVTGNNDRFSARYMVGAGQQIVTSSYTLPVGKYGTEVSALFGFSHVNIDLHNNGPSQPEIIGNAYSYGLLVSQPLTRSRIWVADLGINARRATSFFNDERAGRTDVRSATIGLNYNNYDRYGRSFARIQNTFGANILGANTDFYKGEGFLTRVTRLPKNNLLIASAYGQYSPNGLPPIEQFQLGGMNSVRGYTQGLLLGDSGYNANLEWRWPIPFLGRLNPWVANRLQGAIFADYGQAFLKSNNRFVIGNNSNNRDGKNSLLGAGVGLRYHLTDYLQGYVDAGFGLLNRSDLQQPQAQPTARIHFGIRSELLSNAYKSRTDVVTPIKTNVARPKSVGVLQKQPLQSEVADPTLEPTE
jgi:hemolysin activation/secretion protein